MSKVKVVSIRKDGSGNTTKRLMFTPKRASVVMAGLRASDSMSLTVSGEHDVQQGDEIYYIQDVVDTKNLRGIWNFYGGFRDESGFEQDDVNSSPYVVKDCVGDMSSDEANVGFKFVGHYKHKITSTSYDGIEITKKYIGDSNSNPSIIDLSGNFDVFLQFFNKSSSNIYQTLVDNYDTANSKGFRVEVNMSTNVVRITANTGSGADNVITYTNATTIGSPTLLRITRQGGVFRLQINNDEKTITSSSYSGDLNTTTNMHFFKQYNQSTGYVGSTGCFIYPLQFRFYNTVLEESEAKLIYISKPQTMTMKFGGKVWKVNDKGSNKKISCISFSKEIFDTEITTSTFAADTELLYKAQSTTLQFGKREGNVFFSHPTALKDPKIYAIIRSILKELTDDIYVYYEDHPSTNIQGIFIATGSFLSILKALFMLDPDVHTFGITPRKILVINETSHLNNVVSDHTFNLVGSGKDDTNTANSIYVTGQLKHLSRVKSYTKTTAANDWATPFTLESADYFVANIERITKVTRDGIEISELDPSEDYYGLTANKYRLDTTNNKVSVFSTDANSHVYVFSYVYNDSSNPSGSLVQYKSDPTSISQNGLYHRNISVPQIGHGFDIITFKNNYIADNKNINTRVDAFRQSLVNSLVVGQKVYVHYLTKGIGTISSGVITPLSMTVKSIEYAYPEGTTKVSLGEYSFSGYDVEKQTIDSISGIDINTSVSRTTY